VPRSFASLVEARLAVLSPPERRLLEAAAMVGSTYWLLLPQLAELDDQATASGVPRQRARSAIVAG
jgi:hypothetical protein